MHLFESRKNCKKKSTYKVLFLGRGDATRKEQGDGITEKGEFIRQAKCQMQPQRKERSSYAMSCVFESRKNCKKKAPKRCFFMAGETRLEHATDGFGDRCSTIEPLP